VQKLEAMAAESGLTVEQVVWREIDRFVLRSRNSNN
jgi:hypothetical protein